MSKCQIVTTSTITDFFPFQFSRKDDDGQPISPPPDLQHEPRALPRHGCSQELEAPIHGRAPGSHRTMGTGETSSTSDQTEERALLFLCCSSR
jgi:hypothetical protein